MSHRAVAWGWGVGLAACLFWSVPAAAQQPPRRRAFNGLEIHLGNLSRLSHAQSRSISPENFTGEKGKGGMATEGTGKNAARELGQGWKISPSVRIQAGTTFILGEIAGPGAIQQIWMTPAPIDRTRFYILRFYWDDEAEPSVEVPLGDFFACGWGQYCQINSLAVCVNPGSAFNCYWSMPFRKKAKITLENLDDRDMVLYYQINYTLTEVPEDAGYFHAQFRRVLKLPYKSVYTILDGVRGRGHYVGTYMAWEVRSPGWWGEGEIKFYLDGDQEFPTICGTGTEDYFCGSYNFENRQTRRYQTFSTPYSGLAQVLPPELIYVPGQRFGLYRWHIPDPVRFQNDLRVTIQALGWQSGGRYLPLEDDIASVAFWYQTEPHAKFPALPGKDGLAIKPISVSVPQPAEKKSGS
ncbi:MAG: glycoside hydrolase family 172 protein [Thermoguttaceae bacterium]